MSIGEDCNRSIVHEYVIIRQNCRENNHNMGTRIRTKLVRHSIVASIPACHAGDRGSIPRDGISRGVWRSW